jgi:hypothetical protein
MCNHSAVHNSVVIRAVRQRPNFSAKKSTRDRDGPENHNCLARQSLTCCVVERRSLAKYTQSFYRLSALAAANPLNMHAHTRTKAAKYLRHLFAHVIVHYTSDNQCHNGDKNPNKHDNRPNRRSCADTRARPPKPAMNHLEIILVRFLIFEDAFKLLSVFNVFFHSADCRQQGLTR